MNERQRKAQTIKDAAYRILKNIEKRSLSFSDVDQLNTYFARDLLVSKTRELILRLRELDSAIQSDDIEARFEAIKEQALRSLRDKSDIYEDDGKVIKLGPRHKFSVNTQELDLTLLPRNNQLYVHLTGTDFYQTKEKNSNHEALLKIAGEINLIAKPLIKKMDKKLAVDLRTYFKITELSKKSRQLQNFPKN